MSLETASLFRTEPVQLLASTLGIFTQRPYRKVDEIAPTTGSVGDAVLPRLHCHRIWKAIVPESKQWTTRLTWEYVGLMTNDLVGIVLRIITIHRKPTLVDRSLLTIEISRVPDVPPDV